jgi:hypothetical protein
MSAPLVTIEVASHLYYQGLPFRVRLEFCGTNYDNKSSRSDKWWELTFNGPGWVSCNFGATGTNGRSEPVQYNWTKAKDKCREKLNKGYGYVWGTETSVPKAATPIVAKLTGPFALIREIRRVSAGLYKAFDKAGDYLLDLDEDGRDQVLAADPMVCLS